MFLAPLLELRLLSSRLASIEMKGTLTFFSRSECASIPLGERWPHNNEQASEQQFYLGFRKFVDLSSPRNAFSRRSCMRMSYESGRQPSYLLNSPSLGGNYQHV